MSDKLFIRDVPEEVREWITEQREERLQTQNEFVVDVLRRAYEDSQQLPLLLRRDLTELGPDTLPFTFIDLFAGIGGLRLGLQAVGGRSVFSCEWDRYSQRTYREWFGETPHGDITKLDLSLIPEHDVLAAGFPCQPFSIAGVSKKNSLGRAHGFKDVTQGTLFFHLATIIELKRPPVLLLENVKNLLSHDKGRTWEVIHKTLTDLGYVVFKNVIDAASFVPQHRERVFIVGFDRKVFGEHPKFSFPTKPDTDPPRLSSILDKRVSDKYTLTDHLWTYLQAYAKKHRAAGNGFGFSIADPEGVTRTLSARYYKDGSEILIAQKKKNPRRLTPQECARLMGFPEHLKIVVSDTQAYRQFGNAVVPPVAEAVARQIVKTMSEVLRSGNLLKRSA